jgi:phospholipid/cholesterol/gamma-HCH transport system substrate-binding protein
MSKHANPTLIGIFVAGAIGLIVAGILIISGGKLLFTDKSNYVLYFKGSVKGLNIGSPVSFRGVNIGTVTDIQLVVNEEESGIRIPVIIEIDNTKFIRPRAGKSLLGDNDNIAGLVEAGLRGQLQLQSLLTGQLFIQIDFLPNTPANLLEPNKSRWALQEIPTIQSPIEIIGKLLEDIPMDKVKEHILAGIEGFSRLVNSEELQQSITSLHAALEEFRQLVANLDRQVEPVASNVNLTLDDARKALQKASITLDDIRSTMAQADTTLQSADALFSDEQVLTALDNALNEISSAAYAIRILAETINNQPESLLRGRQ